MEQKFLELIEDGKMVDALFCLRNQITPLRLFPSRVHQLSRQVVLSLAKVYSAHYVFQVITTGLVAVNVCYSAKFS